VNILKFKKLLNDGFEAIQILLTMDDKEFQKSFQMIVDVATQHGFVTRESLKKAYGLTAMESSQVIRVVMQKHPDLFKWDHASSSHRAHLEDVQKKNST
jgi:hypothetical protein